MHEVMGLVRSLGGEPQILNAEEDVVGA
jgi:hypothetical protein